MALWAVGAIINVVGSIMINLGTNIIKLGHTKTELAAADGGDKPPKMSKEPRRWWSFPGNRVWLGGMLLFTVGNMLNLVSFAFTAQSLLSALGVVQFISNIAFGRWVNKEKVTRRVLLATAVVCTGCVLLVAFGNHESPTLSTADMLHLYSAPLYIVYLCFIFTVSPAMYLVYRAGKRAIVADRSGTAVRKWARWLPICYALFAGLLGTQSVLYGKTISMLLRTTITGDSQLDNWYTWLSLVLFMLAAGFWMGRYSKAMKLFPVLIIMPVIQIVWVLFSMVSGSLYFQEYKTLDALSGSMVGVGVVVLLAGMWLLTGGRAGAPQAPPELKVDLSEEEAARAQQMDGEALAGKAPLGDGLAAAVSAAGMQLEPEEALVARRLSTLYDRQALGGAWAGSATAARGGGGGGGGGRRGASPGRRGGGKGGGGGAGSAGEESRAQLVDLGTCDSAAWPADGDATPGVERTAASLGAARRGDEGEAAAAAGGGLSPAPRAASAPGRPGAPPSLMRDLVADWGVGVRDVAALMRASVGLRSEGEEAAAFSIWSMPMASSFTAGTARRSVDLAAPTFLVRTALEAEAAGGADDVLSGGGGRPGRPGHRRLNRSRSANELEDVLRGMEGSPDIELGERGLSSGGLESPWRASSSMAAAASGLSPAAALAGAALRLQGLAGSAPSLSGAAAGSVTPGAAGSAVQMLSSAGSGPRRPWSPDTGPTPQPQPPRSPFSEVGESEGPGGAQLPASAAQEERPAAAPRRADKGE